LRFSFFMMPHFRGHTRDLEDEWARTQAAGAAGALPVPGRANPRRGRRQEQLIVPLTAEPWLEARA